VGDVGQMGVSEALRRFVSEMPWERESIVRFVARAAATLPPGATVLDVGAGDAPYRELFSHVRYRTLEWEASAHEGAAAADIVASADSIPLGDEEVDAVLLTQVLEHVADPLVVLGELHRVLRSGGQILLTVPLVWQLHELPNDYYRYTEGGVRHLLERCGFADIEVRPRNDCFTTVAQLLSNLGEVMGRDPTDGLDDRREEAAVALTALADQIAALAPLDVDRIMPLGYEATASRP
jgi:SAM-dependent methyltransferase